MHISDALRALDRDLHDVFGARLRSVVAYASAHRPGAAPASALAVVETLTADDLRACAAHVGAWHEAGLQTPLLLAAHEFGRSLDAFPLEFGAILADHALLSGANPFGTLKVEAADLRRACEIQARSHLLHLREGYVETAGRSDALAELISRSAAPLAALARSVARLEGVSADDAESAGRHIEHALGAAGGSLTDVLKLLPKQPLSSEDARRLFPPYLDAIEKLANYIDGWRS
jgi:hypothetical protein